MCSLRQQQDFNDFDWNTGEAFSGGVAFDAESWGTLLPWRDRVQVSAVLASALLLDGHIDDNFFAGGGRCNAVQAEARARVLRKKEVGGGNSPGFVEEQQWLAPEAPQAAFFAASDPRQRTLSSEFKLSDTEVFNPSPPRAHSPTPEEVLSNAIVNHGLSGEDGGLSTARNIDASSSGGGSFATAVSGNGGWNRSDGQVNAVDGRVHDVIDSGRNIRRAGDEVAAEHAPVASDQAPSAESTMATLHEALNALPPAAEALLRTP